MKTLPPTLRITSMNRRKASYNAALIQDELRFYRDADPTIVDSGPYRQMWEDCQLTLNMVSAAERKRAQRWAREPFEE